ncbi:MAG TPA: hypothetical protein PKN64_08425 [Casimicrobium sp.]|nr:hypothetical protein [Casimicrobium sp.]
MNSKSIVFSLSFGALMLGGCDTASSDERLPSAYVDGNDCACEHGSILGTDDRDPRRVFAGTGRPQHRRKGAGNRDRCL